MEPLHKDLVPGIAAHLDADGTLTLTQEYTTLDAFDEEDGVETTTIALPAQGARALIKFLLRDEARNKIQFHKGQGHRPQN